MADLPVKILCVHGLSGFEPVATGQPGNPWLEAWKAVCTAELQGLNPQIKVQTDYVPYDAEFVRNPNVGQVLGALGSLGGSWLHHSIANLFGLQRGLFDIHAIHWTAGLLTQWVEDKGIRARCRQHVY